MTTPTRNRTTPKTAKTATTAKKAGSTPASRRWSQRVTEKSDALALEPGVFAQSDPKKIARSLKRSAEHSERRKSSPFRSAMSMLTFYVNRAGQTLPDTQRKRLDAAKDELRALFKRRSHHPH